MKYCCPVCGYANLDNPPYDDFNNPSYEICDCCGFEFGFDDVDNGVSFEVYRKKWLEGGAKWFCPQKRPVDWDLDEQLKNLV